MISRSRLPPPCVCVCAVQAAWQHFLEVTMMPLRGGRL